MKKRNPKIVGDEEFKRVTNDILERWRGWYQERDRQNPNGYKSREIEMVGTIQGKPAYKITCPLCCDKVLWFTDAWWKLECHCNLLWTITVRDDGTLGAWGKRQ